MITMILISTTAILVGIVGCAVIWGMDALRADAIESAPRAQAAAVPAMPAAADTPALDQR